MSETVHGGCLCGNIRYSYAGEIGGAGICHCEDCRRITGSAFNISIGLDMSGFTVDSGEPRAFTSQSERGNSLNRHFCGNCGSPLFTTFPAQPDRVFVKAGSLDDPALVKPALQAWTGSAVSWSRVDDNLPSFEKDPD